MKLHTTNYYNTFITIADDCPAVTGETPPAKSDKPSVAAMQFELLAGQPYQHTSDDVLFQVFALKNDLTQKEWAEARMSFFSKGQPCFRASPLTKRYGWGVHFNAEGKMAIYGCETSEYKRLSADETIRQLKAMRTSKG